MSCEDRQKAALYANSTVTKMATNAYNLHSTAISFVCFTPGVHNLFKSRTTRAAVLSMLTTASRTTNLILDYSEE